MAVTIIGSICAVTVYGYRLADLDLGRRGIVLTYKLVNTKALISCPITVQMTCPFVFANVESRFSHHKAQILGIHICTCITAFIVILVFSHFGFEGGTLVLIASVPGHCSYLLLFTKSAW